MKELIDMLEEFASKIPLHKEQHPMAGKTVIITIDLNTNPPVPKGSEFVIRDWWDRLMGKSWMVCAGNPAAMIYGMRSGIQKLPLDNEVIYGYVKGLGHLVHVSELVEKDA